VLKLQPQADVVGPAPALLHQVRDRFRQQLLVKLPPAGVEALLAAARAHKLPSTCRLSLDSDPYDFL
jgi:primosomal protein N'